MCRHSLKDEIDDLARYALWGKAGVQGDGLDAAEQHLAVQAVGLMKQQHGIGMQPARTTRLCSEIQRLKSRETQTRTSWSTFRLPCIGESQFWVSVQTFTKGERD